MSIFIRGEALGVSLSLILHILFFWGTYLFQEYSPPQTFSQSTVAVDLIPRRSHHLKPKAQAPKNIESVSKNEHGKLKVPRKERQLTLKELTPQFSPHQKPFSQRKPLTSKAIYDKYSSTGVFGVMNAMGVEEYTPMMPYFESLWRKIDLGMRYPQDFVRQRITGSVNVHLVLNEKGQFSGQLLELSGSDSMLKTYVLATLIHLLKTPLPQKKWLKEKKRMPVLLTFSFDTYSTYRSELLERGSHVKNALLFNRLEYVDPKINEAIETFFTHYFPPIIPIPGGFYIDFVFAYKFVKNIGKPTEEEKRLDRLKKLKEQLELSIKKS